MVQLRRLCWRRRLTQGWIPEGAECLQFLFALLLGQCKKDVWQGRMQHRCVWEVCSLYTMGHVPLWIKISPARDLLLLFQSPKEDRTPLDINAPLQWKEKWEEKTSCPLAHLLLHRNTQGQFNTDLHHFERWRDKENITHRTGMDSCPLPLLWELPSPTRSRNSPWGRSPAQREMLKLSRCILHLLTNICWHPIQLCWKQSTLPSLIHYEANHHPWESWAPLNQNCAWGAAPANSGHQVFYSPKTCTALKGLW